MQPKSRKKFRAFLAARRQKLRRPQGADSLLSRLLANPQAVRRALMPPVGLFVVYGLLLKLEIVTPIERLAHAGALLLLLLWALMALRGSVGFWPRGAHLRFAVVVAALVGFGSSWGFWGPVPVKVWVSPPTYARLASVPLDEPKLGQVVEVLSGSLLHISQPGSAPATLAAFAGRQETIEGGSEEETTLSFPVPDLKKMKTFKLVLRRGWHRVGLWRLRVLPDQPPRIAFAEEPEVTARKTIRFAYDASDDFGVEKVLVRIAPTNAARGVSNEPVEIELAAPCVKAAHSAGYADLTSLPWAGLPVTVQLIAMDGTGHKGYSAPKTIALPTRAFRNPFARALIEEREKLLGQPEPSVRDEAANVMAGIARQQGLYRGDPVVLMALRAGAVRLVLGGGEATVRAVRNVLWQTAIRLEEGAIGQARGELAMAQQDLSSALLHQTEREALRPFMGRMQQAMTAYFNALEAERAKQPPALQQMDWPLSTANEMLTPEDLETRLAALEPLLDSGAYREAGTKLDELQTLIENLRTTPPELTNDQYKIVQQTSGLRALVRGQKSLLEETGRVAAQDRKTDKGRIARRDGLARLLSQQQLLLSALRDLADKVEPPTVLEVKASARAMESVLAALRKADLTEAAQQQAEALGLMENSLLALSEKMRRSLTAKAP